MIDEYSDLSEKRRIFDCIIVAETENAYLLSPDETVVPLIEEVEAEWFPKSQITLCNKVDSKTATFDFPLWLLKKKRWDWNI